MIRIILYILLALLVIIPVRLNAQEPETSKSVEDLIEEIANSTEAELDYTSLYEDLTYYLNEPLDLNKATKEDLDKLQFLSDYQIEALLKYRTDYGDILSVYELRVINGFTKDIVDLIIPFITLKKDETAIAFSPKRAVRYGSHQLFLRGQQYLEEQKGYSAITDSDLWANPNSRYLGSPQKLYLRYKYTYKNKLAWGVTVEKDAGEVFFKRNVNDSLLKTVNDKIHNGFDFYSAHLFISDLGAVKALALGDYLVQFGQGLTLWSGLGYGKSSYVLNVKKRPMGIRKYSSVDENLFMRGIATTVRYKNLDFSGFYSKKKIDANITLIDTLNEDVLEVSSVTGSGLHSTPGEFEDKHSINETVMGGNITFNRNLYRIGATAVHYIYGAPLTRTVQPYNQFEFSGSENSNFGLDYQLALNDVSFFGEAAMSENGGMAFLNGAVLNLNSLMSVSVVYRNYNKDYQAQYGSAFGENSINANEHGLFFGTTIYPYKKWKLSGYFDTYKFPWLRSQADAPSSGFDWVLQTDFSPSSKVSMYFKLRQKIKSGNETTSESVIPALEETNTFRARYHVGYQISKTLQLRNRIEYVHYRKGETAAPEEGYMIYQDVIYNPAHVPVSIAIRYALFGTDSYTTGIYAYENDILNSFSVPVYYSNGTRFYITLKYTISKNVDLWLRYAQFYFRNTDVMGSGLTEIKGPVKSEVKVQLRIRL